MTLYRSLLYHESVGFDDLDFKCKLHFRSRGGAKGGASAPLSGIPAPPSGQNFYFRREEFVSVGIFYSIFNFCGNIFLQNFGLSTKQRKLS